MLFKHKDEPQKLKVDLGDLQNEKANLASFLLTHHKIESTQEKDHLTVDGAKTSLSDLHHGVKKFIYHKDLNTTHYLTIEGSTVKINRFKGHDKKDKHKKEQPTQSLTQSWGL